jgi:two-component system, OmpR family, sensor kinase
MRVSLARQLYLRLTISLLCLWLAVVAAVTWVVQKETAEIFDSGLQEVAQRLLPLAVAELTQQANRHPPLALEPAPHEEYLTYQVFDAKGSMLLRSHTAPEASFPIPMQPGLHNIEERHFFVETTADKRYWIVLAERHDHREHTFYGMLKTLLEPLLALLPIALLVTYLAVRAAGKSVLSLERELDRRSAEDLAPIDTSILPNELLRLGETLNSLMSRLRAALESERNFSANSAHELRTPIASAMAQLDVLRDEITEAASRQRIQVARSMLERLEQTATKLLQLARAESGTALNSGRMDIVAVTQMLLRDLSFRSHRAVKSTIPGQPVWIAADVDAIGIVIQNLIENAENYATPGTPIEVEIEETGTLTIRNDCPALTPSLLATLTQRFVRGVQSHPGSGIGLSIVDAILRQSKARLELKSPCYPNGRGFSASIAFNHIH